MIKCTMSVNKLLKSHWFTDKIRWEHIAQHIIISIKGFCNSDRVKDVNQYMPPKAFSVNVIKQN